MEGSVDMIHHHITLLVTRICYLGTRLKIPRGIFQYNIQTIWMVHITEFNPKMYLKETKSIKHRPIIE